MALTPEGTPYVESTDLVANYPAASLSLANRVDLVGVLPFATSAARATAIPSPTDGQYSYLQDTNATEFWNGSAWVAAGSAPGFKHIANVTMTAANSTSVDNCFTSTYQFYRILIDHTVNTNGDARMRLRVGGVDSSANYTCQNFFASGASTGAGRTTPTFFSLSSSNATIRNAIVIDLLSPQLATATNCLSNAQYGSSSAAIDINNSTNSALTAFDGFTFLFGAGVTATGTIRIYGYSNG